jgi:hypothetical protein
MKRKRSLRQGSDTSRNCIFAEPPDLMEADGFTPRKGTGEGSERYADIQQFFVEIPLTELPGRS